MTPAAVLGARVEYATRSDPARNYCLWDYAPPADPEDRLRAVNLLFHSFLVAGLDERAFDMVEAIREAIGPFRTVFGIKMRPSGLAWEFYFYDYGRRGRSVSASRVLAALRPWAAVRVAVDETLDYFMFSLDIDAALVAGERGIDVVHLYIGNPGSTVSSGLCYAVRADGSEFENLYCFFDAATERAAIAGKVSSSAHYTSSIVPLDAVMIPGLMECRTVCVANKRHNDCIYFSGVGVRALSEFVGSHGYPGAMRRFIDSSLDGFSHLLFDVGLDYSIENGRLHILKTGFYGVF